MCRSPPSELRRPIGLSELPGSSHREPGSPVAMDGSAPQEGSSPSCLPAAGTFSLRGEIPAAGSYRPYQQTGVPVTYLYSSQERRLPSPHLGRVDTERIDSVSYVQNDQPPVSSTTSSSGGVDGLDRHQGCLSPRPHTSRLSEFPGLPTWGQDLQVQGPILWAERSTSSLHPDPPIPLILAQAGGDLGSRLPRRHPYLGSNQIPVPTARQTSLPPPRGARLRPQHSEVPPRPLDLPHVVRGQVGHATRNVVSSNPLGRDDQCSGFSNTVDRHGLQETHGISHGQSRLGRPDLTRGKAQNARACSVRSKVPSGTKGQDSGRPSGLSRHPPLVDATTGPVSLVSLETPPSRCNRLDGRLRRRMGSPVLFGSQDLRDLAPGGYRTPHQRQGNKSDLFRSPAGLGSSRLSRCYSYRQSHNLLRSPTLGIVEVSQVPTGDSGSLLSPVESRPRDLHCSPPRRSLGRSGPALEDHSSPDRVGTGRPDLQLSSEVARSPSLSGRPCLSTQSQTPSVYQSLQPSVSLGDRPVLNPPRPAARSLPVPSGEAHPETSPVFATVPEQPAPGTPVPSQRAVVQHGRSPVPPFHPPAPPSLPDGTGHPRPALVTSWILHMDREVFLSTWLGLSHSTEVTNLLVDSVKSSTSRQYQRTWSQLRSWLIETETSILTEEAFLSFLVFLGRRLAPDTVSSYRAALRFPLSVAFGIDTSSVLATRLIRGLKVRDPKHPRILSTWPFNRVLTFLTSPSLTGTRLSHGLA